LRRKVLFAHDQVCFWYFFFFSFFPGLHMMRET
jgi:hypothetical protein